MEDPELKKSFLTSMRGIASTVNVISAISNGERHAMTATSVNSLSIDPPSMLVCINKQASIHKIINVNAHFCINVLSKNQKNLADVCSNNEEGDSRFNTETWQENNGYIFVENSLSNIFCECTQSFEHTTHTIFIGKVARVNNNEALSPLIYGSGKYLD